MARPSSLFACSEFQLLISTCRPTNRPGDIGCDGANGIKPVAHNSSLANCDNPGRRGHQSAGGTAEGDSAIMRTSSLNIWRNPLRRLRLTTSASGWPVLARRNGSAGDRTDASARSADRCRRNSSTFRSSTSRRGRPCKRARNRACCSGRARGHVVSYIDKDDVLMAEARIITDPVVHSAKTETLMRMALSSFESLLQSARNIPSEVALGISRIDSPAKLADEIAPRLPLRLTQRQSLLDACRC